jgi:adenylylsulfate kinase-like enzyme
MLLDGDKLRDKLHGDLVKHRADREERRCDQWPDSVSRRLAGLVL